MPKTFNDFCEGFAIVLTEFDAKGDLLGYRGYQKGYTGNDFGLHGGKFSINRNRTKNDAAIMGYKNKSHAVKLANEICCGFTKGINPSLPFELEVIDLTTSDIVWCHSHSTELAARVRDIHHENLKPKNLATNPKVLVCVIFAIGFVALYQWTQVLDLSSQFLVWFLFVFFAGLAYTFFFYE